MSFSCWRGAVFAIAWVALSAPAGAGVAEGLFGDGLETGGLDRWTCITSDSVTTCPVCTAAGDACIEDLDCCNSYCDRPGGIPVGQCAAIGSCLVFGEPCTPPGSGSCCSGACLPAADGGARCERIGGCRTGNEMCTSGAQCCSGSCVAAGLTADGRTIQRCASGATCGSAGELCTIGSANCCPAGGGSVGCETPFSGVDRCFGGVSGCVLPGDACTDTIECCAETFANIQCQAGPGGNSICCLGGGESCAFGDVCCSGLCTPDEVGDLVCAAGCAGNGATCTTSADCCDGCCRRDGAGGLACTTSCGGCALGQLGEACDLETPCCPELICGGDPNFQTCQVQ